jgi:hypothetical protein
MMQNHLAPCPSCTRHVRASEPVCPFCQGQLSDEFRTAVPPRRPAGRLTRAALYAFGATSLSLVAACGSSNSTNPPGPTDGSTGHEAAGNDSSSGMDGFAPHYGAPSDASFGDGQPTPAYGATGDSGIPLEAAPGDGPLDGPLNDEGGAHSAYGSPAHDF